MSQTYNGYTNYETWAVSLWIDNDQGSSEYWREQAQEHWDNAVADTASARDENAACNLAEQLKEEHEEGMPKVDGLWADLLNAALSEVNWHEIATGMIEEVDKEAAEAE